MRTMIVTGLFAVALTCAAAARTAFVVPDERWCATYAGPGGGGVNCGFYTLEQCRAAISGVGGSCDFDYWYQAQKQYPRVEKKRYPKTERF